METQCAKIQMLFGARVLQQCINKTCIRPGHSVQRTAVGSGWHGSWGFHQHVAGVLIGDDSWVSNFVAKKARAVITDVCKLDVISNGYIHLQLLNLCQNRRLGFLGRNTPTPLISDILKIVDNEILDAVCRNGRGGENADWAPYVRKFADTKLQLPHFWGGFRITLNVL